MSYLFFFFIGGLNKSKCCNKGVCSECFLKIQNSPTAAQPCPFCKSTSYEVVYSGPPTREEIESRMKENEKYFEIEEKVKKGELERVREFERRTLSLTLPDRKASNYEKSEESVTSSLNDVNHVIDDVVHNNVDDININNDINNINQDILNDINFDDINLNPNIMIDPEQLTAQGMTPDQVEEAMLNEAIRLSLNLH